MTHAAAILEAAARRGDALAGLVFRTHQAGDIDTFYALGHELLNNEAQRARAAARVAEPDPLTLLIEAHLQDAPDITTTELVAAICRAADVDPWLSEFDGGRLWFFPREGGKARSITMPALRRRIQRLRHQPGIVATS